MEPTEGGVEEKPLKSIVSLKENTDHSHFKSISARRPSFLSSVCFNTKLLQKRKDLFAGVCVRPVWGCWESVSGKLALTLTLCSCRRVRLEEVSSPSGCRRGHQQVYNSQEQPTGPAV